MITDRDREVAARMNAGSTLDWRATEISHYREELQSQPPAKPEPMGDALEPCPFCGGAAARDDIPEEDGIENAGGSYIFCTACLANSALVFGDKSGLNEKWNRRAALAHEGESVVVDDNKHPPSGERR